MATIALPKSTPRLPRSHRPARGKALGKGQRRQRSLRQEQESQQTKVFGAPHSQRNEKESTPYNLLPGSKRCYRVSSPGHVSLVWLWHVPPVLRLQPRDWSFLVDWHSSQDEELDEDESLPMSSHLWLSLFGTV